MEVWVEYYSNKFRFYFIKLGNNTIKIFNPNPESTNLDHGSIIGEKIPSGYYHKKLELHEIVALKLQGKLDANI